MCAFKQKFQVICALALIVRNFGASSTQVEQEESAEELENVFNSSGKCVLNLTNLHYELHIDPIRLPKYINDYADVNNISVSAWVKIKGSIYETKCNEDEDIIILLRSRRCKIDFESVRVTKNWSEDYVRITNQTIYHQRSDAYYAFQPPALYTIQLQTKFTAGDHFEIYIPYELESDYDDHYGIQGLHIFDTPQLSQNILAQGSSSHFYPIKRKYMFPEIKHTSPQKATFKISVSRSEKDGYVALSNMGIVETTEIAGMMGWVCDHFEETPPLSVDQVTVMILGGFDNHTFYYGTKNATESNLKINIWTTRDKDDDYAVEVNETRIEIFRLLQLYGNKFVEVGYPFSKLDIIVEKQTSGHSNIGIIKTRPADSLLFLPYYMARQWIGEMAAPYIVYNDLCHQTQVPGLAWYVAEWGTTIYTHVNEMRSGLGYLGNWDFMRMFVGLFSGQIMESAVAKFYLPTAIKEMVPTNYIFDAVQQAVIYHNATHLLPLPNATISDIKRLWKWYGNNSINVNCTANDTTSIQITVHRDDANDNAWIPIKIYTDAGSELLWLPAPSQNETSTATTFTNPAINTTGKWVVVGSVYSACFYIRHDDVLLANIIQKLRKDHTVIPYHLRECLLSTYSRRTLDWDDAIYFLDLTKYLKKETNVQVWTRAIYTYDQLHTVLKQRQVGEGFSKMYFGGLINSALKRIGATPLTGESKEVSLLRIKLLEICATYEAPLCLDYSKQLMIKWMDAKEISPFASKNISDIRENVICAALKAGPSDSSEPSSFFHFLLDRLINIKNDTVDEVFGSLHGMNGVRYQCDWISRALTCSNDDTLLIELLSDDTLEKIKNNVILRDCYISTIVPEIGRQRPYTMTDTLLYFWKRMQQEGIVAANSFTTYWNDLTYLTSPEGVMDKVNWFLDRNKKLFIGDVAEEIANLKSLMDQFANSSTEFWKNDYYKIVDWLRHNILS